MIISSKLKNFLLVFGLTALSVTICLMPGLAVNNFLVSILPPGEETEGASLPTCPSSSSSYVLEPDAAYECTCNWGAICALSINTNDFVSQPEFSVGLTSSSACNVSGGDIYTTIWYDPYNIGGWGEGTGACSKSVSYEQGVGSKWINVQISGDTEADLRFRAIETGVTCDSHDEQRCYDDDLYWYDGCGDRETKIEDCPYGCGSPGIGQPYQCLEEDCSDDCSAGATECYGTAGYKTCGDYDITDSCLEWSSTSTYCDSGETCSGGECVSSCTNECSPDGETECYGTTSYWTCGDHDIDPCLEWSSTASYCDSGETCSNGVCAGPSCSDECASGGLRQCYSSSSYQSCGNYDVDDCLEWGGTTSCASGMACEDGECVSGDDGKICYQGDVWYGSGSTPTSLYQECGARAQCDYDSHACESISSSYEVPLDGEKSIFSAYSGMYTFYVDIPSSYDGDEIETEIEFGSNPPTCLTGNIYCGRSGSTYVKEDECNLDVTPGQRLYFKVGISEWHTCTANYSRSLTVYASSIVDSGPVCGDGTCSSGETCTSDSCCSGYTKSLSTDEYNCGSCGNRCSSGYECVSGTCTLEGTDCAVGCLDSYIEDGECDAACNVAACDYDGGDCEEFEECASGCLRGWLGDEDCDPECNNAACDYDGGDCEEFEECAEGCLRGWLGDGDCDEECDVSACDYDDGDCEEDEDEECATGCLYDAWIGDGGCDDPCNVAACDYDGGDCDECSDGCDMDQVGDGTCDADCNNSLCDYDDGDCDEDCSEGCAWSWIGDGDCDDVCNVAACEYDDGDCEGEDDDDDELSCGDDVCSSGETCTADECCSGVSKNLDTDEKNCGSCGATCQSFEECIGGSCIWESTCGDGICEGSETDCPEDNCCDGMYTLIDSDPNNCGACANACFITDNCIDGVCIDPYEAFAEEECETDACEEAQQCIADISAEQGCLLELADIIPYLDKPAAVALAVDDFCYMKERVEMGDPIGIAVTGVLAIVDMADNLADAIPLVGNALSIAVDIVEGAIDCIEGLVYEYGFKSCGGYTRCLLGRGQELVEALYNMDADRAVNFAISYFLPIEIGVEVEASHYGGLVTGVKWALDDAEAEAAELPISLAVVDDYGRALSVKDGVLTFNFPDFKAVMVLNPEEKEDGYNIEVVAEETVEYNVETTVIDEQGELIKQVSEENKKAIKNRKTYYKVEVPEDLDPEDISVKTGRLKQISFGDLKRTHWAYDYVIDLAQKKVIGGYEDGTFRPSQNINRAELLKIVMDAFELSVNIPQSGHGAARLEDVKSTDWFSDRVFAAAYYGIVQGYEDNTYRPGKKVNRAEALKIILEASGAKVDLDDLKIEEPEMVMTEEEATFSDVPEDAWYAEYVQGAAMYGIVGGYDDGTFRPTRSISRAEAAKIVKMVTEMIGLE